MGELTAPRKPLNDPELYLNPEDVPREGYGATAIRNLVGAAMAVQPDPVEIRMGGGDTGVPESASYVDPAFGMGSIGRFSKASKKGNVLHAAREFAQPRGYDPLEYISARNKSTPRQAPGPIGVARADLVAMPKFEGNNLKGYSDSELKELIERLWDDAGTVHGDPRYSLDYENFNNFEKAIKAQGEANVELTALTKKPLARKLYNEGIDRDLYREKNYGQANDVRQDLIDRLMAENSSLPGSPKLPKGMRPRKK